MTHAEFVDSLRKLADFYEAHPDLQTPYLNGELLSIFASGRKGIAAAAREFGTSDKATDDTFYRVVRREKLGEFTLQAIEYRSQVCRRVVKGTEIVPETVVPAKAETIIPAHEREIVEWECEPLLAGGADEPS